MDSASKIDTVDIYLASMVNQGTIALAMELDFDQSSVVLLVVDVSKQVAMDHFVVAELLAEEVAEVSIVLLVDIFYSTDFYQYKVATKKSEVVSYVTVV